MSDARSFAALRQPAFRGLFTGASLAMMADSVEHVISYWMLFEKFQLPALGGLGMRTFSGVTIGLGGSLVGIHWSLGISAVALLVLLSVGLLFATRSRRAPPA
jgi:hypothetical protein